jgi:hypothetical protein
LPVVTTFQVVLPVFFIVIDTAKLCPTVTDEGTLYETIEASLNAAGAGVGYEYGVSYGVGYGVGYGVAYGVA